MLSVTLPFTQRSSDKVEFQHSFGAFCVLCYDPASLNSNRSIPSMISKYFNPYTDFGFKKLFGEEGSKDLLIDFLNQLLPTHHQITKLSFKNPENLSTTLESP